ncbi:hypothetical protein Taro_016435, partial [Colocasia esculenta]|nr:hypothetical protein [Colocasia esculenta]
ILRGDCVGGDHGQFLIPIPFTINFKRGYKSRDYTFWRSRWDHLCPSRSFFLSLPSLSSNGCCVVSFSLFSSFLFKFVSALLVWVRRRHPERRHRGSDACYVAIGKATGPSSLSEHSLEGLRKSPLTVDSHTVAGLVVPVAT